MTRDAGLRLALWRLHIDHYHGLTVPLTHPATGEPYEPAVLLDAALDAHKHLHDATTDAMHQHALPKRHTHREHDSCGGTFLPARPPSLNGSFHECDTCGARRHAGSCVDPEDGKIICGCGLEDLETEASGA